MLESEKFNFKDIFYKIQKGFKFYLVRIKKFKSRVKRKNLKNIVFYLKKKTAMGIILIFTAFNLEKYVKLISFLTFSVTRTSISIRFKPTVIRIHTHTHIQNFFNDRFFSFLGSQNVLIWKKIIKISPITMVKKLRYKIEKI